MFNFTNKSGKYLILNLSSTDILQEDLESLITRILCILLFCIHIARRCTVHTVSKFLKLVTWDQGYIEVGDSCCYAIRICTHHPPEIDPILFVANFIWCCTVFSVHFLTHAIHTPLFLSSGLVQQLDICVWMGSVN